MKRLPLLLILLSCGAALASYETGPSGDNLTGTFSGTVTYPITLAIWVKRDDWPVSDDSAFVLSEDTGAENAVRIKGGVGAEQVTAQVNNNVGSTGGAAYTAGAAEYDAVWVCVVAVFASTSSRTIYIEDSSNTAANGTLLTTDDVLDLVTVGTGSSGLGELADSLVAEPAIWGSALDTTEVDSYCGGAPASSIDSANLLGYWPLDTDQATHTDQSGNGGPSLVENSGIVFNADHPTISASAGNVNLLSGKFGKKLKGKMQ